jgi:hypothetical protein
MTTHWPARVVFPVIGLAVLAACGGEAADYQAAIDRGTVEAYDDYLARYPAGAYANEARAKKSALEDSLSWAHAESEASEAAYETYLAQSPSGAFAVVASARRNEALTRRLRLDALAFLQELYEHPLTEVLTEGLTPTQGRDVAYMTLTEGWGYSKRAFTDSGAVVVGVPGDGPMDPSLWPPLVDPWDGPVRLEVRIEGGSKTPTIVSPGPDREPGTTDDLRYPPDGASR